MNGTTPQECEHIVTHSMVEKHRTTLANISVGLTIMVVIGIIAIGEFRMRAYVDYPWLHDRTMVLDKLDSIDNRIQRFEYRTYTTLKEQMPWPVDAAESFEDLEVPEAPAVDDVEP